MPGFGQSGVEALRCFNSFPLHSFHHVCIYTHTHAHEQTLQVRLTWARKHNFKEIIPGTVLQSRRRSRITKKGDSLRQYLIFFLRQRLCVQLHLSVCKLENLVTRCAWNLFRSFTRSQEHEHYWFWWPYDLSNSDTIKPGFRFANEKISLSPRCKHSINASDRFKPDMTRFFLTRLNTYICLSLVPDYSASV